MNRYVRIAYWVWYLSIIIGGISAITGVALDLRVTQPGILGPILVAIVAICGVGLIAATFFILAFEPVRPRRNSEEKRNGSLNS